MEVDVVGVILGLLTVGFFVGAVYLFLLVARNLFKGAVRDAIREVEREKRR
jgi:hypothetical protein